jgi:3-hydroxyisobutyrate dehydrogenase
MNIGLMGIGLMGKPMVECLLSTQQKVVIYNRTASKSQPLQEKGAIVASSPAELLQQVDVVILMLSDATAIQETLFSGTSAEMLKGRTVIQMGTIAPHESQKLQVRIQSLGGDYLEAPVLGSIAEVQNGTLQIMVGSSRRQFERWTPLLKHFTNQPLYVGAVGSAATLKLALNQLIASLTAAFSLSLGLVLRQNVDVELFMQVLRSSVLHAPTFDRKLPRLLQRDFSNPNFPTKHLLKDVNLFLNQASVDGLNTKALEGLRDIIILALEMGLAEGDYSAIHSAINPQD